MQAKGEFEVKRIPQDELDIGGGASVGHSRFDKRFHGPLEATSVVHMLALMTPVQGSGAYVAMERIEGTLDGRRGSFYTQHNGIMDRGKPSLDQYRPFCSRRCGDIDLNRWLSGVYAVPVQETDDDPDRPRPRDPEAE